MSAVSTPRAASPWIDPLQLRLSLYCSWLIVSIPLLLAVILPLVAPESLIHAITPRCVWKVRFGRECPSCGLTTAFIDIGRGAWRQARTSNAGGIPLYAAFVLNSLFWFRSLIFLVLRKSRKTERATPFALLRSKYVHNKPDMGNPGAGRNAGGIFPVPGKPELVEYSVFGRRPDC
jgi:hypothetical protein